MNTAEREIKIIKPTKQKEKANILRVAAYCRVSTNSDDQLNSFFAQMQYYNDYVRSNDSMILVDIYADEGISGTSIAKRSEFKRMLSDSKNGKIDRLLVKSVQRFARNSLECIEAVRELKSYGTSVFFENDNIDTENMNSEMFLYIKSAFAQNESLSHSKRISTSIRMKMEDGTYNLSIAPYGYKLSEGGLEIVPEEADNVKKIFNMYESGIGENSIVKYLQTKEKGEMKWSIGRINYILKNERYIGDCLLQKYYTPPVLPLKDRKNNGQEDKFYYEGTHEAIISKETFEAVKKIHEKRKTKFKVEKIEKDFFHDKIKCRKCGWVYRAIKRKDGLYWGCSKKGMRMDICHAPNLRNDEIQWAFIKMFNNLFANEKEILSNTIAELSFLKSRVNHGKNEVVEIDNELATLGAQNRSYSELYSKGILNEEIYYEKSDFIKGKMTELRNRRIRLINEDVEEKSIELLRKVQSIVLEQNSYITRFNTALFDSLVDKIYIEQDGVISFILKGDLELKVRRGK